MAKYKLIIQSYSDPTDHFEVDADAIVAFTGTALIEENRIDHGMVFSGNKQVMKHVIAGIPPQVSAFLQEEQAREEKGKIVMPDGKEVN